MKLNAIIVVTEEFCWWQR